MKQQIKDDLKKALKEYGVVTGKELNRGLNKVKTELLSAIANVAINSPTSWQFNDLEKRVSRLETSVD